jgi:hypothetical protein
MRISIRDISGIIPTKHEGSFGDRSSVVNKRAGLFSVHQRRDLFFDKPAGFMKSILLITI